jgi:electron transport complex protein RnfB
VPLTIADQLENLLPQTQCTKCGYPSCRAYAEAISDGVNFNQCPPGGQEGVERLATLLGKPFIPLNIAHGLERSRPVAVIDEAHCIGCTLCIQACPVDAIIGAAKQMHTVISDLCTGCDLCVAPCPVDCINMLEIAGNKTGWNAWSQGEADQARRQFDARQKRLLREKHETEGRLLAKAATKFLDVSNEAASTEDEIKEKERKKDIISAAIERARLKKIQENDT